MRDEYYICVKTDLNLGDRRFVENLLKRWCNEINPKLRPERFDLGEPVRRKLQEEGINAAIDLWLDKQMPVVLKRVSQPKLLADINWRPQKGLDPRKFPWHCTIWLNFSAGDELALDLFRFLIEHFKPAFGWITTYLDQRDKHFITFKDRVGQVETFVGREPGNMLPGIYWATYFGAWAIDKIGETKFQTLQTHKLENAGNGLLVLAYPSCREATTPSARQAEEQIKQHLGRGFFFDKTSVDIESLRPSARDAEIIEAAVAKKKSEQASKTSG